VHTALNVGGALVAACLNESFQDVQQLIPFVFRLLQYTSGVMFSVDRILATNNIWLRRLVLYNPLVYIIDLYRWAIMGTTISVRGTVLAVIESGLLLLFGLRYFRAAEHRYGRA
jgi:teichoic acid transport system permease protein